jgi:hypothetical protein
MLETNEQILNNLGRAIQVTLENLCERCQAEQVDEPGSAWASTLVSSINGLWLDRLPATEPGQRALPFSSPHSISCELYRVAGGGMAGGPTVDVLLQVWYDTESLKVSFGIPLLIRQVPSFGPIPASLWLELRDTCRMITGFSCAGRALLIGHPDPFHLKPGALIDSTALYAVPMTLLAGMIDPPRGMSGHVLEHFAGDLVSGWIGDPALAGYGSVSLTDFLKTFHVTSIVRLSVTQ